MTLLFILPVVPEKPGDAGGPKVDAVERADLAFKRTGVVDGGPGGEEGHGGHSNLRTTVIKIFPNLLLINLFHFHIGEPRSSQISCGISFLITLRPFLCLFLSSTILYRSGNSLSSFSLSAQI